MNQDLETNTENEEERTRTKLQSRLTECWSKLPAMQQKMIELEEEKERRLLLKEAREELWKRWRQKKGRGTANPGIKVTDIQKMERKIERIEKELADQEERRQREKDERIKKEDRLKTKKRKEQHWEMLRWIVAYLEENKAGWEETRRKRKKMKRTKQSMKSGMHWRRKREDST